MVANFDTIFSVMGLFVFEWYFILGAGRKAGNFSSLNLLICFFYCCSLCHNTTLGIPFQTINLFTREAQNPEWMGTRCAVLEPARDSPMLIPTDRTPRQCTHVLQMCVHGSSLDQLLHTGKDRTCFAY